MSIASEIQRIKNNIASAYTACRGKGATIPATENSANLPACIASIPSGGAQYIKRDVVSGTMSLPSGAYTLPTDVTNLDNYAMRYVFQDSSLTSADLSSLTSITGESALYGAFSHATSLASINLSSLTSVNTNYCMHSMCYGCSSLTSVNFASLETINISNALYSAFQGCTSLTSVSFPSLEHLGGSLALGYAFSGCTNLQTVDFSSVYETTGTTAIFSLSTSRSDAFQNCSSLTTVDFSGLITVGNNTMKYAFYGTPITTANLSSLTTVGSQGLTYAYRNCTRLTSVDLSGLYVVNDTQAMQYMFTGCTALTSVDLTALTTVGGSNAMSHMFDGCTSLISVDLSSLTTVGLNNNSMTGFFDGCTNLASIDLSGLQALTGSNVFQNFARGTALTTITFPSLITLTGQQALRGAFTNCTSLTSISFPALTSTSFSNRTNQFNTMLSGVSGCTVHFPSNLQSVIGSWSDVTGGFGGTNTTVLFDLTATS